MQTHTDDVRSGERRVTGTGRALAERWWAECGQERPLDTGLQIVDNQRYITSPRKDTTGYSLPMKILCTTVGIKLLLLAVLAVAASSLSWSAELASSTPAQTDSQNSKTAIEAFARAIQKRIAPRTSALVTEGDKNNEAIFPVVIDPDGNVQSISVKTSSGDPKFDSACMEVIKKAGLPKPLEGAPLKFNLVVRPEHSTRDPDYKYFHQN